MKISPEAFARSSSARLRSSGPSRRKQTTENRRGAHSSQPGSDPTHDSNADASATPRRTCSCRPARPKQRSTAHSFSARKRRPSAGPYSLNESASSASGVRRYSGIRLKAARKSSGREVHNSEQSVGVSIHLWALTTSESARSTPANAQRNSGHTIAVPAYAASTCSQAPLRAHASATASPAAPAGAAPVHTVANPVAASEGLPSPAPAGRY